MKLTLALVLRYKIFTGVALVFLPVLIAGYFVFGGDTPVDTSSITHVREATVNHMNATLVPSVSENPVRQELSQQLAVLLIDESLTSKDRLVGAERGMKLLEIMEEQIDVIETTGDMLKSAQLEMNSSLLSGVTYGEVSGLIDDFLMISSDIRGLSYKANFQTEQIFRRIINDKGVLTDAHKQSLNALIPMVEEQFDARSNLYSELESVQDRILALLRT